MPNRLSVMESRLGTVMGTATGETVTVSHGGYACNLTATILEDRRELEDRSGQVIQYQGVAVHFTTADLELNGIVTEPKRGMRISRDVGDETIVYEVQPPGGNQQLFNYLGTTRQRAVMYAVQVKTK